jgi:phospholipase/carboxylesterase
MTLLLHDIVPPRRPGPRPAWCVVLHGLGDTKDGWKQVTPLFHLDHVGWIFVQAPLPYGPGWSWCSIDLARGADPAEVRASRARLDDLLGHLLTSLRCEPSAMALLGFSQGCLMALDQILHRGRVFAGVVGISGFTADVPEHLPATALQQRILWTHGTHDPVIPLAWTRGEAKRLIAAGLPADWRVYEKDHSIDPEREVGDIHAFLGARLPAT